MATEASQNYVQKMFVAFLGRAAAPGALEHYGDMIDADPEGGKAILFDDLWNSDQARELYDGESILEIIRIMYNNVMNRDPADAGLQFYYGQIVNEEINFAQLAAVIADNAAGAGGDDFAEYTAKITAADATSLYLETAPADEVAAFQSNFDLSRSSIAGVTADNVVGFDAAREVQAIASGLNFGSQVTLTTSNDTVVGTTDVDTITGTLGGAETFNNANDSITDATSGDGDVLNLSGSGDADLSLVGAGVTGIETINFDLEKQDGAAFAISGIANDAETVNVTVAATTEVVGIEVAGETEVGITDLASDLNTTGVTTLTLTTVGAVDAFTVTGDSALTTITVDDANDSGVSIVLSNESTTVNLEGLDGTNDAVSISAPGAVSVDVSATANNVDLLTLSGNGAAVTYTITGGDNDTEYTITGDQDVTLQGDSNQFNSNAVTNTSTGDLGLNITANTPGNIEEFGVLGGGLELSGNMNDGTFLLAAGNTVTVSATQSNDITFDSNDATGTDRALTLNLDNNSDDFVTANFDSVTINTGATTKTINSLDMDANDEAVTIAGTAGVTVTTTTAVGSLDMDISGAATFSGDVTASEGAIDIVADSVGSAGSDVTANNDATTITTTNDLTLEDLIPTGTGNTVTLNSALGSVDVNDVTAQSLSITAGDNAVVDTIVTSGSGGVSITANDIDIATSITATNDGVTLTGTGALGDVDVPAITTNGVSGGDIVISGNDVGVTGALTSAANVSITSTTAAIDDVTASSGNITISGGTVTAAGELIASTTGTITISDSAVTVAGGEDVEAQSILITGGCDVDLGDEVDAAVINASDATGAITAEFDDNGGAEGVYVYGGSGDDDFTVNDATVLWNVSTGDGNDSLTMTAAGASTISTGGGDDDLVITAVGASTIDTGAGDDTVDLNDTGDDITITTGAGEDGVDMVAASEAAVDTGGDNDSITLGNGVMGTVNGGDGTDTLVMAANDYTADGDNGALTIANIEKVDITNGNATISHTTFAGDNTFELIAAGDPANEFLTVEVQGANDATVDASGVTTGWATGGAVNIDGGAGNDSLTGNNYSQVINGGAGDDTIEGGNSLDGANDVLAGNDGEDTINGGAGVDWIDGGNDADTMNGGSGADVFYFDNDDAFGSIDFANDSMDTITGFVTTEDHIDISVFGDGSIDVTVVADGNDQNDADDLITIADQALTADADVVAITDAMGTGDTYVYIDIDNDGDIDDDDLLIIVEDATLVAGDFQ